MGALSFRLPLASILGLSVAGTGAETTSFPDADECPELRKPCTRFSADPAFQKAIAPFVADIYYPHAQEEAAWRLSMEPFVPLILSSLHRPDPCDRLAALELASRAPGDARVLETLVDLYREAVKVEVRAKVLDGLAFQARKLGTSSHLRDAMAHGIRDPALTHAALRLAEVIATSEDVPLLGEVFLSRDGINGPQSWMFVEILKRLGGPEVADIMGRALAQHPDVRLASVLLAHYFPERVAGRDVVLRPEMWGGGDMLDFLTQKLPAVLALEGSDQLLLPILFRNPVMREGSSEQRARYWERCRALFGHRPVMLTSICMNLARVYGPDELGDLEKAAEALRTVVELDPTRAKHFQAQLDDIQRKLAAQQTAAKLSVGPLTPAGDGAWEGALRGDSATLTVMRTRTPVCFIDYLEAGEVASTVHATWSLLGEEAAALRFRLVVPSAPPGGRAVRARLLFLPRAPDDLRVALTSDTSAP